jgi:outer membrane receptor for ferrienterochelin and colicins
MNRIFLCILATVTTWCASAQSSRDSLPDNQLGQVVVTAQFAPTDARQSVSSVRVLSRQTIERRAVTSLGELLQAEPNIRITQDPVLGSAVSLNGLRGENLKILIDGVPVTGRLNGSIDAGQLPMNAVQQVEIIEGAQSLLYGSEASAGVINLVTRKSQLNPLEAEASAQVESSGIQMYQARTGVRMGKILLQLSGNSFSFIPQEDSTVGRDQIWNPKQQLSGRAMLRFNPSKKFDLRVSGGLFNERVDNPGDIRRPQYRPYAFDDYYNTDRTDITTQAEGWTKNRLFWQATAGWNRFYRVKNSFRYDFETSENTLLEGQQDTASADGLLTRFTLSSDVKERAVNFLAGIENYAEVATGQRISDTTSGRPGWATGNDLGIFGSARYKISQQLTLQGGARMTLNQRFGSALTPAIWMLWQPSGSLQARFSYANGFRSPGLKELFFNFIDVNHYLVGNVDLQPEKSHNLRSEITQNFRINNSQAITARFTAFYNLVYNRIVLAEFAPVQYQYINLDKWQTTGTGLGVTWSYNDWLRVRSELVVTGYHNEFAGDTLPRLSWSPDWVNDINLQFFNDRLFFNIWHKFTGRTPYFFEDQGEIIPGESASWHLVNISAGTNLLKNRFRINAGIKNLAGITQIRSGSSELGHNTGNRMLPVHWGRTYFVSVTGNIGWSGREK